MKEPVDHILRPQLPWRVSGGVTECGYDAIKVKTISRPAYLDRVKDMGQQRLAMMTCMTCSSAASRWDAWQDDPRQAMQRKIEWEGCGPWYRHNDRGRLLQDELLAIESLIETHRAEFDAHVAATDQRRDWLEKKAASAATRGVGKPKVSPW